MPNEGTKKDIKTKENTIAPKGLMERRQSFAQSSVPNAHKGYNSDLPIIMIIIISLFILISLIFATAAVMN